MDTLQGSSLPRKWCLSCSTGGAVTTPFSYILLVARPVEFFSRLAGLSLKCPPDKPPGAPARLVCGELLESPAGDTFGCNDCYNTSGEGNLFSPPAASTATVAGMQYSWPNPIIWFWDWFCLNSTEQSSGPRTGFWHCAVQQVSYHPVLVW